MEKFYKTKFNLLKIKNFKPLLLLNFSILKYFCVILPVFELRQRNKLLFVNNLIIKYNILILFNRKLHFKISYINNIKKKLNAIMLYTLNYYKFIYFFRELYDLVSIYEDFVFSCNFLVKFRYNIFNSKIFYQFLLNNELIFPDKKKILILLFNITLLVVHFRHFFFNFLFINYFNFYFFLKNCIKLKIIK